MKHAKRPTRAQKNFKSFASSLYDSLLNSEMSINQIRAEFGLKPINDELADTFLSLIDLKN